MISHSEPRELHYVGKRIPDEKWEMENLERSNEGKGGRDRIDSYN